MEFTIRPALLEDAASIAHVHVESWTSTYMGIVPEGYLASLKLEDRVRLWQGALGKGDATVFVAEDEAGFCGFAAGGGLREPIEGYDAELYAIYLLRDRQLRGIGRDLVRNLVASLVSEGRTSMIVWVLQQNPAVSFYRRLGGTEVGKKGIEIGGAQLEELCFGWVTLETLNAAK
jgi:ribosomal protein S18 acetylase RimI-like enzyme